MHNSIISTRKGRDTEDVGSGSTKLKLFKSVQLDDQDLINLYSDKLLKILNNGK